MNWSMPCPPLSCVLCLYVLKLGNCIAGSSTGNESRAAQHECYHNPTLVLRQATCSLCERLQAEPRHIQIFRKPESKTTSAQACQHFLQCIWLPFSTWLLVRMLPRYLFCIPFKHFCSWKACPQETLCPSTAPSVSDVFGATESKPPTTHLRAASRPTPAM